MRVLLTNHNSNSSINNSGIIKLQTQTSKDPQIGLTKSSTGTLTKTEETAERWGKARADSSHQTRWTISYDLIRVIRMIGGINKSKGMITYFILRIRDRSNKTLIKVTGWISGTTLSLSKDHHLSTNFRGIKATIIWTFQWTTKCITKWITQWATKCTILINEKGWKWCLSSTSTRAKEIIGNNLTNQIVIILTWCLSTKISKWAATIKDFKIPTISISSHSGLSSSIQKGIRDNLIKIRTKWDSPKDIRISTFLISHHIRIKEKGEETKRGINKLIIKKGLNLKLSWSRMKTVLIKNKSTLRTTLLSKISRKSNYLQVGSRKPIFSTIKNCQQLWRDTTMRWMNFTKTRQLKNRVRRLKWLKTRKTRCTS
jgi:hypothetical protein